MISAERKHRKQRTSALTFGVNAEIAMGTAVLVWSISPWGAGRAVFGTGGSIAVVATAMVLLAAAMPVIRLAPRLGRKVLLAAVVAVPLASACLGVIACATLLTEPGMGFVLLYGWGLTIPVAVAVSRARVPPGRTPEPEQGRS
ncbi:MAG: hypothetical protein ACRDRP_16415 [Pseudonocardiaceae bacterium]